MTFGGSPLSTQQRDWDPRAAGDGFPATLGECGSGAAVKTKPNQQWGGGRLQEPQAGKQLRGLQGPGMCPKGGAPRQVAASVESRVQLREPAALTCVCSQARRGMD